MAFAGGRSMKIRLHLLINARLCNIFRFFVNKRPAKGTCMPASPFHGLRRGLAGLQVLKKLLRRGFFHTPVDGARCGVGL